jgi:ketosteroid isomerase-like protein
MPALTPEAVHAVLEDAFNRSDLDAYTEAYEPLATLVVPPEGRVVSGRAQIRAATAPVFAGQVRLRSRVLKTVDGGGLALTHARWELTGTDADGTPMIMTGRGTIVSQRRPDGTWGILLDDPMSPEG